MNIGIDIDGVLTNDDDYILDFTSKYCYENNLNGFDNANLYEYRKLNWDKKTINSLKDINFKIFGEFKSNKQKEISKLQDDIKNFKLDKWNPKLASKVYTLVLNSFSNTDIPQEKLEILYKKLCKIDINSAFEIQIN